MYGTKNLKNSLLYYFIFPACFVDQLVMMQCTYVHTNSFERNKQEILNYWYRNVQYWYRYDSVACE